MKITLKTFIVNETVLSTNEPCGLLERTAN